MKVSGFSFIRNAIKYDYQIKEAIESILPVCDEFIIAVGKSDDATRDYILSINSPKIKILDTVWDDTLREGGHVLAAETNKAFDACSADSDWCFYIQGDEVIHENDLPIIVEAMRKWQDDKSVQGLVFDHINFYGTYEYYADARHHDKKEVRIIRKDTNIRSYKDAASFRMIDNTKLHCKYVPALIYHYGYVRPPKSMQLKQESFHRLYHKDTDVEKYIAKAEEFDYAAGIDSLAIFKGTHPAVMASRIARTHWTIDAKSIKNNMSARHRFLNFIYKKTGWHIGAFKNYKLI